MPGHLELDEQVEQTMVPFARQRQPLATVPGIGPLAAVAINSEVGPSPAASMPFEEMAAATAEPNRSRNYRRQYAHERGAGEHDLDLMSTHPSQGHRERHAETDEAHSNHGFRFATAQGEQDGSRPASRRRSSGR